MGYGCVTECRLCFSLLASSVEENTSHLAPLVKAAFNF